MLNRPEKKPSGCWKFCPKCKLKLYGITKDCHGLIYIKCGRCHELLLIDLSEQPK